MRRLPIYFLVDVSESMAGTPIEEVERGMRTIIQELRVDPYALETPGDPLPADGALQVLSANLPHRRGHLPGSGPRLPDGRA